MERQRNPGLVFEPLDRSRISLRSCGLLAAKLQHDYTNDAVSAA